MFPFIRPLNIHPPASGGGAPATGRCVYCSNPGCAPTCVDGVSSAACTSLHNAGCGGAASPQWTEGAVCGGPFTIDCGGI